MKKISTRLLSMLLSAAMLVSALYVGALPAVAEGGEIQELDETTIIENADSLANGVQSYFKDSEREYFVTENQQMKFEYALREENNMLLTYLKDKDGNSYIENTLDAFVVMNGSSERVYASNSSAVPLPNLHRLGYYYYDVRIEGQNFINEYNVTGSLQKQFGIMASNHVSYSQGSNNYGQVTGEVTSSEDPFLTLSEKPSYFSDKKGISYDADTYRFIRITMATDPEITGASFFFQIKDDEYSSFHEDLRVDFSVSGTGSDSSLAKEYMVPMFTNANFKGTVEGLRLDFNGRVGSKFNITKLEVVEVNMGDNPHGLFVNRDFLVYSDKMHSFTQFTATQTLTNLAEVGVEVKLPKTKVEGYVVKADGTLYENSLAVSDWNSAEYAGFIVSGAGVFGYIMPADNSDGKLTVTDEGDNYVIRQTINPENTTIIPSEKGMETPNGNDIFMGQRLYTDDNFNLNTFITEAENERNPIPAANFSVSDDSEGEFVGYDAIRGCYKFNIDGYYGFNDPYYSAQNKQFKINYTIEGEADKDRKIWVMSYWSGGMLECAALLDANGMMIPVPMQVGKNFSESHGERNKFNLDDPTYSETIYPMDIKAGSTNEYTLLNIYQNWGQNPVKQLSWIQYSSPYYHLSTGVSESNCITPLYGMGKTTGHTTLPDFRGMSSPLWSDQPQHNSSGNHRWLIYTDESGNSIGTESTKNTITSYGPNYASVDMEYISDDGKIKVTYTHMEMPQTDENRTYYEMKYTVLSDVTINDFKNDLQFYSVGSNDPTGTYTRVGYLNESNESAVAAAMTSGNKAQYVLGDECPYFSYFDMDNATSQHNQPNNGGYSNVAFLVYNSDFTMSGEKVTPNFVVNDLGGRVAISLNLGKVELKAGDTFTINAILLPWGSHEMEGLYDTIQDKNVRDVRQNTLLDPITATPIADPTLQNSEITTARVEESVFLPRVETTNGQEAVFTLTGGENNQTVRVDGFTKLTDPKIYELKNGKWSLYEVCSALTPDTNGDGYSYDGYGVYYDGETDTFSYTFVVDMSGDAERTFKVVANEDFDGWETTVADAQVSKGMNLIFDGKDLHTATAGYGPNFGGIELNPVAEEFDYVRYTSKSSGESYFYLFDDIDSDIITGNYVVIKYRTVNKAKANWMEIYTATTDNSAGGSSYPIGGTPTIKDDEWHLMIVDIAAYGRNPDRVVRDENGALRAKHLRIDVFNEMKSVESFDIAYIGMSDSISEIFEYEKYLTEATLVTGEQIGTTIYESSYDKATITVGNPTVNPDALFLIPVTVENNVGFSYLELIPEYDRDKFTFMGFLNGDVANGLTISGNRLIWKNTTDCDAEDGTLVNLAFKPKVVLDEDTPYEFSVKIVDANKISGAGFNYSAEAGSVTFKTFTYGNVNGDVDGGENKVTSTDIVALRKYIVKADGATVGAGADVNCDGIINSKDIVLLRKYFANYNYDTGESSVVLGPQIDSSSRD